MHLGAILEKGACLHDIGLVDGSDFLTIVCLCKLKGEPGGVLTLAIGCDLERLNDTRNDFLLQTRVLTLHIFTNDNNIQSTVARVYVGECLARNDLHLLIKHFS